MGSKKQRLEELEKNTKSEEFEGVAVKHIFSDDDISISFNSKKYSVEEFEALQAKRKKQITVMTVQFID